MIAYVGFLWLLNSEKKPILVFSWPHSFTSLYWHVICASCALVIVVNIIEVPGYYIRQIPKLWLQPTQISTGQPSSWWLQECTCVCLYIRYWLFHHIVNDFLLLSLLFLLLELSFTCTLHLLYIVKDFAYCLHSVMSATG